LKRGRGMVCVALELGLRTVPPFDFDLSASIFSSGSEHSSTWNERPHINRLVMGMVTDDSFHREKSLDPGIVMHAMNNFFAYILPISSMKMSSKQMVKFSENASDRSTRNNYLLQHVIEYGTQDHNSTSFVFKVVCCDLLFQTSSTGFRESWDRGYK